MVNVSWPRACIGCGETSPALLSEHSYLYKHQRETGRSYTGYNTVRVSYEVISLPVSAFLCKPCEAAARRRYVAVLIGLLVWSIGGWVFTGLFSDYKNFEAFMAILMFSIGATIASIAWAALRWNPARHYHKVRYSPGRQDFSYAFRSPDYKASFMQSNPGRDHVKVVTTFP
jgi:hypothetical protein